MPKLKARSRRKPPSQSTTSLTSTTKLNLKPIRPKSPKFEIRNLKLKTNLPTINPKLFSLSLLLYFFLFLFLDQVPPEKVANIPLYQAYLPLHLLVFLANLTLLSSFLSSSSAFLIAFFIQSLIFFKLQDFKIEPRLISNLAFFTLLLGFMSRFFKKLRLSRKLKSFKLSKKPTRLRVRRRPRSRLAR